MNWGVGEGRYVVGEGGVCRHLMTTGLSLRFHSHHGCCIQSGFPHCRLHVFIFVSDSVSFSP